MAGNPYPANLPWANLGIAAGGAVKDYGYIWDRSARDYRIVADVTGIGIIDTIPQGAGFWTHSTMARTVRVNPLTGTAAVKTPALVLSAGDYILPLQATTSGCADTCAAAGVIKAADTLPGAGRLINPPAAGAGVDLYFLGGDGAKLAYDIRSKAAGTETWDFEVLADIGDVPVSISLPDVSGVPLDKQITLIDTTTGRRIYVRTTQLYTYQAEDGQPRRFTLEIAPRSVGSLNISATSAAMSRGGQVAVTYALSQPAGVSISVMNIGGREVKQLTAGKAAASGVNTEIWDLTNSHGAGVPAGRYLLSIIATTDTGQQARAIVPVQVNR